MQLTEKQIKYSTDLRDRAVAQMRRIRGYAISEAARGRIDRAISFLNSIDPATSRFFLDYVRPVLGENPFPYSTRSLIVLLEYVMKHPGEDLPESYYKMSGRLYDKQIDDDVIQVYELVDDVIMGRRSIEVLGTTLDILRLDPEIGKKLGL